VRFVKYYFDTMKSRIKSVSRGATQDNLSLDKLLSFDLLVPPLPLQRRIGDILSAYDDLIDNNTRRIKILEDMAQMLYREWFLNFRFPGHEKVRMVESELGPIPDGWAVKTLGELADITMGQSPPSESYNTVGTGLPFHQGVTDFGLRFPADRTYCTIENRLGKPQDILMSVRAPVGRRNISTKKIVIGRGLCAIRSQLDSQAILFQQL
jgi:type I restriction enzyme S subunit